VSDWCNAHHLDAVYAINIEKSNAATVPVGIHPSNVVITNLKLDSDRRAILDRKGAKGEKKAESKKESEDVEMVE
jgi:large subunit ribosomal protein L26e